MIVKVNKDVISFLFKGELPSQNANHIQEAKQVTKKSNYTESKDTVDSDDLAQANREAGNQAQQRPTVTETIVRDQPKINRGKF